MTTTPEAPTFPEIIDSSMLTTYRACPQKFFRSYIQNLTPTAKSPHLHAGGAFAAALEAIRLAAWRDKTSEEDAVAAGLRTFIQYWGDYESLDEYKTFDRVWGAVEDYVREYPLHSDPVRPYIKADGSPAVEFTFAQELPIAHPETGNALIFAGRFDLLGYFQDQLYVVDEKTTKALGESWTNQWKLRSQFLGYCWACHEHDYPVVGALIRGIAIQKTQYKHLQQPVLYPKWQIERWYETSLRTISDMIRDWHEELWDHNYGESCASYGGCAFTPLCSSPQPDAWLSEYETRTWNPLHKDPTTSTSQKDPAV